MVNISGEVALAWSSLVLPLVLLVVVRLVAGLRLTGKLGEEDGKGMLVLRMDNMACPVCGEKDTLMWQTCRAEPPK